jgi:hypothetical protein
MNILSTILDRLNQRIEVGNIFDKIYGLSELVGEGNDKAWAYYIGNGQAIPVTDYDAKQGTLFWAKRGKINVTKNDSLRLAGCRSIYETRFSLTAYAMVRKSHLPCDAADAQDWVASRVLRLISGTDPQFKTAIGAIAYEVVPSGYQNEIRYLPVNYEWAAVAIEVDVNVSTSSEDGCYDTCATGDIPLPDFEPCEPCLTSVAVDGVTITGNGTPADPLVAIGGGGGTPLRTQDEGIDVSTNTTTLNFTGSGVTASLTSPGVVEVNIPSGGGGGVTSVTGTAPIASSGGATPDISITQATSSSDGYLSSADWNTFDGKQDALTAGTGIDLTGNVVTNTAPDQVVSLTAGTGISTSGIYPSFTIDNTAPDQIVAITQGTGIIVSGTYPNFTITNSQSGAGGGASVNYYLNGSINQGTLAGNTYRQMSRNAILGGGTDFQLTTGSGFQVMQRFITDAGDPAFLSIPAGAWVFDLYFSASSGGGSPQFYVELFKYDGVTFTSIANNSATPEGITNGTAIDLYQTSVAVPNTALAITDRLAIVVYVDRSGRTITLHTEDNHLCEVLTTFSTGITALNGLTDQVQTFAIGTSGTDFGISSATGTHTFNLPTASASNRGALSSTDWSTFNGKFNTPTGTTSQYIRGDGSLASLPFELVVAASDETTALTAGNAKITFRMPRAVTLTAVRASLTTAQTSGNIFTVDINEAGTSILSTKITIDNTEKTSTTAATPPVISDTALADDAEITIDIDQIGDGTAKGLKVALIGTYA